MSSRGQPGKRFWQTAIEGRDTKSNRAELGISTGAVYIARSRVIARLRQRIEEFERIEQAVS